jgi:hypothetical protein
MCSLNLAHLNVGSRLIPEFFDDFAAFADNGSGLSSSHYHSQSNLSVQAVARHLVFVISRHLEVLQLLLSSSKNTEKMDID